jgi:hypothetical protein
MLFRTYIFCTTCCTNDARKTALTLLDGGGDGTTLSDIPDLAPHITGDNGDDGATTTTAAQTTTTEKPTTESVAQGQCNNRDGVRRRRGKQGSCSLKESFNVQNYECVEKDDRHRNRRVNRKQRAKPFPVAIRNRRAQCSDIDDKVECNNEDGCEFIEGTYGFNYCDSTGDDDDYEVSYGNGDDGDDGGGGNYGGGDDGGNYNSYEDDVGGTYI